MKTSATLFLTLALLLAVPALAGADQWDRIDAMRLRAEIRREVREWVRHARHDAWWARRDAWRAGFEARREAARIRRDALRAAHRAARDARRGYWRW
jgi:hypothetical protein